MTKIRNILQRALEFDLADHEIEQLASNLDKHQQLELAEQSNTIANELIIPGYTELVASRRKDIRALVERVNHTDSSVDETKDSVEETIGTEGTLEEPTEASLGITKPSKRGGLVYKLMGLAATVLLLAAVIFQPWQGAELTQEDKRSEVKRLALLSFESSGLLSGERGEGDKNQEFSEMYEKLKVGDCEVIEGSGTYQEQTLWLGLYCALLTDDLESYDRFKSIIVENRYPNFEVLRDF